MRTTSVVQSPNSSRHPIDEGVHSFHRDSIPLLHHTLPQFIQVCWLEQSVAQSPGKFCPQVLYGVHIGTASWPRETVHIFRIKELQDCPGSVTRSIVILHQKVFTEGLPSKWKHCFFQDPPVAHLVESALQNNNWRFCMLVECCPNGHSPASGLNPGLDTCLMVQFIFATPHTNPPIMPVQLETGLIAEYNMLPLGNLDSEVGPGPVQASISVSCGEQGLPHWSPCTQASLDQSGVHQRPGNPDSYGPLPLSSEGVCRCCPAVHAKADQETIIPC